MQKQSCSTPTENPFRSMHIEYHILQSFPVTCLNRDEVGSPKTAFVGGVERARVSSQCWKRPVRMQLHEQGVKLAIRSKKAGELIARQCIELGATEEQAKAWGEACVQEIANDTLYFFQEQEAQSFAQLGQRKSFIVKPSDSDEKKNQTPKDKKKSSIKEAEIKDIANNIKMTAFDGLDIALFGRMIASAPSMNIEAASSFSHALSIHEVNREFDFFTGIDDLPNEQGAAHMGTLEFNSATYYRYISLDLGQLYTNLGESAEDVAQAVEQFTKALYLAVPAARQNSMSGGCSWGYAKILVRKGQRRQFPLDTPVKSKNGFLEPGIEALTTYLTAQEKQDGTLFQKKAEITFGHEVDMSIDQVIEQLKEVVGDISA